MESNVTTYCPPCGMLIFCIIASVLLLLSWMMILHWGLEFDIILNFVWCPSYVVCWNLISRSPCDPTKILFWSDWILHFRLQSYVVCIKIVQTRAVTVIFTALISFQSIQISSDLSLLRTSMTAVTIHKTLIGLLNTEQKRKEIIKQKIKKAGH